MGKLSRSTENGDGVRSAGGKPSRAAWSERVRVEASEGTARSSHSSRIIPSDNTPRGRARYLVDVELYPTQDRMYPEDVGCRRFGGIVADGRERESGEDRGRGRAVEK